MGTKKQVNKMNEGFLRKMLLLVGVLLLTMSMLFQSLLAAKEDDRPEAGSLEKIFFLMREKFNSIGDYQCIYESYTTDGRKEQRVTYKYFFKKPKMIRMEILTGKYKGTILIYNQRLYQDKVRVRFEKGVLSRWLPLPTFLLRILPQSFPVDHKWFVDLGHRGIHQSDLGWYIDYHFEIKNRLAKEYDGRCESKGGLVFCTAISNIPQETDGIHKEELWIDKETYFPVKYFHYDISGKVIRESFYKNVNIDTNLKDQIFEIK